MASRRLPNPTAWTLLWVLGVVISLQSGPAAAAGKEPEADAAQATRTVTVGKAKLHWHLQTTAPAPRTAALIESFRKATEAHLTGAELPASPKAELITLPDGNKLLPLPSELIHAMFAGPAGAANYCSNSTVPSKTAAVSNADGEGR